MASSDSILHHDLSEYPTEAWETDFKDRCIVQNVEPLPLNTPTFKNKVRFVCLSDTHMEHRRITVPPGDVLLHAGDFTMKGYPKEVKRFNDFLGTLPHRHKIVIAGNHEPTFDPLCIRRQETVALSMAKLSEFGVEDIRDLLTNCAYLEDSGTEVYGIKIYGSPWQPLWYNYGFNLPRGDALQEKWNLIPTDTDILITHGPPLGYGDRVTQGVDGNRAGCVDLLQTVKERVKPKYHLYGHIHGDYGIRTDNVTTFINAACCNNNYRANRPPIIFDISLPDRKDQESLQLARTGCDVRTDCDVRTSCDEKTHQKDGQSRSPIKMLKCLFLKEEEVFET